MAGLCGLALARGTAAGVGLWRWEIAQEQARISAEIAAQIAQEHARVRAAELERRAAEEQRWTGYLDRLRAAPGIVVTEAGERDGKFVLRACAIRSPRPGSDFARVRVRSGPRRQSLAALSGARSRLRAATARGLAAAAAGRHSRDRGRSHRRDGIGDAPLALAARTAARLLPAGGPQLDLSQVQNVTEGVFAKLRQAIQAREIRFNTNDSLPAPGQDAVLDQLAGEIKDLMALASTMHVTAHIRLTGHADDTGPGTLNLSLSIARAGAAMALLKKRGVPADLITIGGAGQLDPLDVRDSDTARSVNRRVSVAVSVEDER